MAPPPPSGSASYKKKDGMLIMAQDRQSVSWIPAASGASGAVKISVAQITSMAKFPRPFFFSAGVCHM